MKTKDILKKIVLINKIHFETYEFRMKMQTPSGEWIEWDGSLSYLGIKRLLFSIWNKGRNERGEELIWSPQAQMVYDNLVADVKALGISMPFLKF